MEATILGDPKDVNGDLRESRKDGGGKSAKKKTCREGEERDNYPWVSEAKMASDKYTSYDAT